MAADRNRRFISRLFKRYIVVIYNESNLEEKASLSLTPLNMFLILTSMVAVSFLSAAFFIAFTPLRETIPMLNNSAPVSQPEYNGLLLRMDSLEHKLEIEYQQEERFRLLLKGDSASSVLHNTKVIPGRNVVYAAMVMQHGKATTSNFPLFHKLAHKKPIT